ncbi:MAG: hypothetical protein NT031_18860 [Planctomycetota bacterium]|nr:hypothetical protein [Planctomycetota bacterium]
MELDTCAIIGRLNLPAGRRQSPEPSSYNISRLGLVPVAGERSPQRGAALPQEHWPVVVAEPALPPTESPGDPTDAHHAAVLSPGPRRKTSFTLPAELLEQVRAHATATHTYQYAVVAQALASFFGLASSETSPPSPGTGSPFSRLRRILNRLVGRRR